MCVCVEPTTTTIIAVSGVWTERMNFAHTSAREWIQWTTTTTHTRIQAGFASVALRCALQFQRNTFSVCIYLLTSIPEAERYASFTKAAPIRQQTIIFIQPKSHSNYVLSAVNIVALQFEEQSSICLLLLSPHLTLLFPNLSISHFPTLH